MSDFPASDRNKVKRVPKRGHYDKATIYPILDAAFVCHLGFSIDGQPFVIPTAYGRDGKTIYVHGATTSRMMMALEGGIPVCLTVTHLDGIVLARSAFHHSMNYRSVVVFGKARKVTDEEKEKALLIISENILKGRWAESRLPSPKELKATTVLAISIEEASAKIRTGPPSDDQPDYNLPIWAGVIPVQRVFESPIADPKLNEGIPMAQSVYNVDQRGTANGGSMVYLEATTNGLIPADEASSAYFKRYINLVPKGDIVTNLKNQSYQIAQYFLSITDQQWDFAYAPGKWTIKQVLLHIIDTERVMAYRAMRIARNDQTPLPGFDQDEFAEVAQVAHRSGISLIKEYEAVRQATIILFEQMEAEALQRIGKASDNPASPLAMAYIIAGHELHHLSILKDKYAP